MTLLKVFKSVGFWMFILLFILVDALVIFTMEGVRSNWTLWVVQLLALMFYANSQFMSNRDKEMFFFQWINKNKKTKE